MDTTPLSLSQLGNMVKQAIAVSMPDSVWVVAEIAEFREQRNGHCYLELIEKDATGGQIAARMKANIWAYTYRLLKPYFETTTRQQLMPGIKVLVKATVEYQEVFGLSLNIRDIDPSFTLGDIERRRRQIIARLQEEGVLEMNKELAMPMVVQRIAVVSSPTAAGYEDFVNQLTGNSAHVKYYHKLFPAIMQGEQTEASVIAALDKIYEHESLFDVVVVIRGGGAAADLMSFDSYDMAVNMAQFPIPVLTGIGHERDFTVADLVAHTHLKTPTAVAEFIVGHNQQFVDWLNDASEGLVDLSVLFLNGRKELFAQLSGKVVPAVNRHLALQRNRLVRVADKMHYLGLAFVASQKGRIVRCNDRLLLGTQSKIKLELNRCMKLSGDLSKGVGRLLLHQQQKINHLDELARLSDPRVLLKRGYSITMHNGKVVKSATQLAEGDVLKTIVDQGVITSAVSHLKN
jgi:exodeoxyribonuclease VII large subunit